MEVKSKGLITWRIFSPGWNFSLAAVDGLKRGVKFE
jgi:hypothetical protein